MAQTTAERTEPEDQEDSDSFPQPEETVESTGPPGEWNNPEWMAARFDRWNRHAIEQNDWESWCRPDWWSPAWEALGDVRDENGKRLPPGSPLELKESITADVLAMDQIARETQEDSGTGETLDWNSNSRLINVASGVLWNKHGSTLLRRCGEGVDPNELSLNLFQAIVKIVPNGCNITYATCSD
jgi:hypothetical protein